MRRTLLGGGAVALIAAPTALAFFSGGFFDRPRLVAAVVAWCLVLVAAVAAPRPLPSSPAGRVALAGLFLLCAWTALSLSWAPIGGRAEDDLQRLVLYLGFFAASLALLRGAAVRRWIEPALVLGAFVLVVYALSERLLPGLVELARSRSSAGRLEQPISYWNALGLAAALGVVLAVRVAGDTGRERALRGAAAAAAVPLGVGVYLSFSRGALAATGVGLLVLLALTPQLRPLLRSAIAVVGAAAVACLVANALPSIQSLERGEQGSSGDGLIMLATLIVCAAVAAGLTLRRPRGEPRTLSLPVSRPAAVATLAVAATLAAGVAVAALEGRPEGTSPAPGANPARLGSIDTNRYRYWEVAVSAFAAHPLQGLGSGGFYVEWLKESDRVDKSGDAHSVYVETLAELGVVGFAFLLMFLGGIAVGVARLHRLDQAAATGPAAALVTWGIHAGLDWDWEMPAVTLTMLLIAAAAIAWSEELGVRGAAPAQAAGHPRDAVAEPADRRALSARNHPMRMTKALLGLALVLALAVPTPALAQSAGDDQYVDPFQEEPAQPQGGGDQGGGDQGGGDQGSVAPEPAPEEPVAPAPDSGVVPDSSVVPEAGTTTVAPSGGPTLPRTGLPVLGLVLAGGLLFAGGFALRRSA